MHTLNLSKNPLPPASAAQAAVMDWLAANGIDELIPEQPTFLVQDEPFVKRIVYRAFKFDGDERGYDMGKISEGYLRLLEGDRSVPLTAPLTGEVRAAFDELETAPADQRCFLLEVRNGSCYADKANAYRQRLGFTDEVVVRAGR